MIFLNPSNNTVPPVFYHNIDGIDDTLRDFFSKEISKDVYCLMICTRGTVKFRLEGGIYTLSMGDVCIYTPERNIKLLEVSDNIQGLLVGGANAFVRNAIHSIFSAERVLYMRSNPTFHLQPEQQKRLFMILESGLGMFSEANVKQEHEFPLSSADFLSKSIMSVLEAVCFYVIHIYSSTRKVDTQLSVPTGVRSQILHKFLISLYYNYIKERTVEFYSNQQNLSKRYFSTAIKQESGKNPKQWIEDIVIEEIKHYLSNDSMTIKEIAYHFNFPSQSFFGKYFKQSVGMSPKDYRDMVMGGKGAKEEE